MSNPNATVYIKAKKHTILQKPQVTIGDIASIACTDQALHEGIKKLPLYTFPASDEAIRSKPDTQMEFFTMLRVISIIQENYPQVQIESIGEQDFIVEYQTKKPSPKWMNHCKTAV